jgi:hypothetical protein
MADSISKLLHCAEEMFGNVLSDIEPYSGPERLGHILWFRAFTECQYQYCRGLRTLYEADCLQGAIPLLRSLMEVSVAQIVLRRDTDSSALLELLKGEAITPGGEKKGSLKDIGWPALQSDIYARLSKMTHPSRISAFFGRTVDFESEPLKSLVAQKDLAGIAGIILWRGARESEEAQQERWIEVALNTFDIAISSLLTLYEENAPESHWWRLSCIS